MARPASNGACLDVQGCVNGLIELASEDTGLSFHLMLTAEHILPTLFLPIYRPDKGTSTHNSVR